MFHIAKQVGSSQEYTVTILLGILLMPNVEASTHQNVISIHLNIDSCRRYSQLYEKTKYDDDDASF